MGALAAVLVTSLASAQCPAADAFEPNDSCATATPLVDGSYPGLTVEGTGGVYNDDFYSVTLPGNAILAADCFFSNASGDVDVYFYDLATSPNCGGEAFGDYLVRGFTGSDNENVTWTNNTALPMTIIVRVELFSAVACNDYSLDITTTSLLVCPGNDTFEPNEDCSTPSALAIGTTDMLAIESSTVADEYWWTYTAVNNDALTIDVIFADAGGDIDVYLYDDAGTCVSQVDSSLSTDDNEQVTFTNLTGVPVTLTMRVFSWDATCNDYTLQVGSIIDPCVAVSDDAMEPNDDCSQAIALTTGTYTDLVVFKNVSDDFFTIDVPDGGDLTVDVLFLTALGDIDCYLYDSATVGTTCGDKATFLDNGFTGSDNEQMTWTNSTGVTQTYYIQVNLWDNAGNEQCNEYDLVLTVDTPVLGTVMCLGDGTDGACPCSNESTVGAGEGCNSSLGYGSILTAAGSASVGADDISFSVTQARATQPGMLVQGASLIGTPFKDGRLCAGTPTERVEVVFTDASGNGTTVTSIVTNGGVSAGDTRYYQMWSRDPGGVSPCGTGSNFSNGLMITYTP